MTTYMTGTAIITPGVAIFRYDTSELTLADTAYSALQARTGREDREQAYYGYLIGHIISQRERAAITKKTRLNIIYNSPAHDACLDAEPGFSTGYTFIEDAN